MNTSNINILIVEDEPIIAEDIADFVLENGYLVSSIVYTKEKALMELQQNKPDLALLDVNLKRGSEGIEIAAYIKEHIHIPFIFLTSYSDKKTIDAAKQTHPMGYITKPINFQNLFTTLEIALFNFPQRQNRGNKKLCLDNINAKVISVLTPKEFEVLEDIYIGKNNQQIAEKHFVSINTIKTHIKKIYDKLDVHSRSEVIARVRSILS